MVSENNTAMLLSAAREAQNAAYAPYSRFPVGAAVLLSDDSVITGCNIENASYGLAICAERVALFNSISQGRLDIVAIAVVTNADEPARPCGACRQVIAEFSPADRPITVISVGVDGKPIQQTILELLPDHFTLL